VSDTHPRQKPQLVFLNTSDVLLGKVLHRDYSQVSDWPGQAKKSIRKGDILFSEIRPANGRWAFIDFDADDFVVSTKLMVIRCLPNKVLPRFLYHVLTSSRITSWLQHLAESRSGTFPQITFDQVAELEIVLPSLREQIAIASFLDLMDDKIELNRQINDTLEAMAQGIFKDWFVDFGPTCAMAEDRPCYLASDLWSLFPDSFDGRKPAGWRIGELQDIVELNPQEPLASGTVAPYLDMAALPTSGSVPDAPMDRAFTSGMRFRNGDTLLARITPCLENGKTAFIQCLTDGSVAWGSTEFIVMRPRAPVPKPYGYILARETGFRARAIQSMTGTSGRQRARTDSLAEYPVAIPPDQVWRAFGSLVEPIFKRIRASSEESQALARTRDLLLPKVMSGEIRVKDLEKTPEAVL